MELSSTSVALVRCGDYREETLAEAFERLVAASCPSLQLHGARVLLKPNLITARRGLLACTEGRFVLAAARWLQAKGCAVAVGDSPAFGTVEGILYSMGIAADLRRSGVRLVDFGRTRQSTLPTGVKVGLAAEALDCDLLVNLPRVKAHAQMRLTLAVKNYFGCVGGMRKPLWHMVHGGKGGRFAEHLIALLAVLPDGFTLVDGITAMHRTGPTGGEPFALNLAACSRNPVALDRALLEVLGITVADAPLQQASLRAGIVGADIRQLTFPLLRPENLRVDNFAVPELLMPVRFNPSRFCYNSCRRVLIRMGLLS
jgi:uncharacterized protein (DUF362 family)